jgi:hypothetical protein
MTGQERDYDEVLSRVLHSTADQVEPVGDGLAKIRARLAEPWLKRQWWLLRSELMVLGWVLTVRCQSWLSDVRSGSAAGAGPADLAGGVAGTALGAVKAGAAGIVGWLRSLRTALGPIAAWASANWPGKAAARLRKPAGPAVTWLRPALAVAGAVVLVVAGVFALGQIRQSISLSDGGFTSGTSSQAGPGSPNGYGGVIPGGQSPTQGPARSARHGTSPRNKVTPSPAPCATPTPAPIGSPTPTPTPTPTTPTPTPTPTTPTPTPSTSSPIPSTSPGPAASDMDAVHVQVIRLTALAVCEPVPTSSPSPTSQAPGVS